MKTKLITYCATLLLAAVVQLNAGEPPQAPAITHSPEFDKLKTLVGTWKGTSDMGQGPIEMVVQYRILAGGSVIEQRCFQNTPNEMVTMFYDKGGKLALTHYCMLGNQPAMALKASDGNSLTFDFDASCCSIDPKKESHMHGMTLKFNDADTYTSGCSAIMNGQEMPAHEVVFKRVKTEATAAR
jgi:hypothetical protein